MKYNYWWKNSFTITGNTYLGRFYNSGQLRGRMDFPGTVPVYINLIYTYNNFNFFRTSTYFFEDEKPSYLIQNDNFWSFNSGIPLGPRGKAFINFSTGKKKDEYYQSNQFSRVDTTDITTFRFHSPGLGFEMNSLNRRQFASNGAFLKLCFRFVNGQEHNIPGSTSAEKEEIKKHHNWFLIRFLYENYFESFGRLNLGLYLETTLSSQPLFTNFTSSVLAAPAFQPVPEAKVLFLPEFRSFNYASIGLKGVYNLAKNFDFRLEGYVFQPFRHIEKKEDNTAEFGKIFSNRYYVGSGMFVYHLPFGPMNLGFNYYDKAEESFSFNFSIGYYIFNKRPFE